jgi:outer membrane beta-barrel protein
MPQIIIKLLILGLFLPLVTFASEYQGVIKHMEELRSGSKMPAIDTPLFSKKYRLGIAPTFGSNRTDPYMDTYFYGAAMSFYWSNPFGLELSYYQAKSSVSSINNKYFVPEIKTKGEVGPKTNGFYSANLLFTPIYAKISLPLDIITHYDFTFTLGVGSTKTSWGTAFTYNFGAAMSIFFTRWVALNLGIRDYIYAQKNPTTKDHQTITRYNLMIMGGLGIYLF